MRPFPAAGACVRVGARASARRDRVGLGAAARRFSAARRMRRHARAFASPLMCDATGDARRERRAAESPPSRRRRRTAHQYR
ncbi:hypothetical protein WS83_06700 [Burkholderia sp. MSMB2042]|nr:hypothetical protein WS77_17540 [Burkholderia sp. MSMB0265]KVG85356.1 hypothetical protein WS81_03915 [Burkholderia sp. MSMB2040]KVG94584.1 hypothetical protein WS83_06700 [Burkholderia sp. MSMB2042]KVG95016.1 hypothetical protein WS82_00095 [Burkholderia sp. MSMB2041]